MLGTRVARDDLTERVVDYARQEAEMLASFAQRRLVRQNDEEPLWTGTERVLRRTRQLAEAIILDGHDPLAATSAARVWARVRAILMNYTRGWTVEEFVLFHLTGDEYRRFPYGLAVSDLKRLADGAFPIGRIRSAMTRLARKGLIERCRSKRRRHRPGNPIAIAENVWFYAGPTSLYAEDPERVLTMHDAERDDPDAQPRDLESAGRGVISAA
ncbi:MAG: hypothetical protein D6744_10875 [Planctomycetota bacterium]|nr:MAG: hypothetical protein D6744_10875 [Planctomycetota bacterium]